MDKKEPAYMKSAHPYERKRIDELSDAIEPMRQEREEIRQRIRARHNQRGNRKAKREGAK